jgi:hypothetical protein
MEAATSTILTHWHIPPALLPRFLDRADGLAALALLCNAGAKDWSNRPADPSLYRFKAELVRRACEQAGRDRSWRDEHQGMSIYFVETSLCFLGEPLQLAFHFRPDDTLPALPADWPAANSRRWRGQAVQAQAFEIALDYLCSRGIVRV